MNYRLYGRITLKFRIMTACEEVLNITLTHKYVIKGPLGLVEFSCNRSRGLMVQCAVEMKIIGHDLKRPVAVWRKQTGRLTRNSG